MYEHLIGLAPLFIIITILRILQIFIVLAVAVATTRAGLIQVPTLTSQDANTYRSYGNLGQVSTFSKTISTPYSSVSKSDVRISNPGYRVATVGSPLAYSTLPASSAPLGYVGAPALTSTSLISPGYVTSSGPLVSQAVGLSPLTRVGVANGGLLGVAYSAAPAVSHTTYSNGLGLSYAW